MLLVNAAENLVKSASHSSFFRARALYHFGKKVLATYHGLPDMVTYFRAISHASQLLFNTFLNTAM